MDEKTQLKAMAAELQSAGYRVRQDVHAAELDISGLESSGLADMQLDLVAELIGDYGFKRDRPSLLVVEVANRQRAKRPRRISGGSLPRYVEDDEALGRFSSIAQALADRPDAELEIRFFDVSVDQSAARSISGPLKSKAVMQARILDDLGLLIRSAGRDRLSRALVIGRLWANWLRIIGHLYPGREQRELPVADLRTIQKDLYDQKLIETTPLSYRGIHKSLLAAYEGGDFDLTDLIVLERDVRNLLRWAGERFDLSQPENALAPNPLYEQLIQEINEHSKGERRDQLLAAITTAWLMQGTDAFPKMVLNFLIALGREPIVSEDLITELLETAAGTAD